jgi:hypothetical protein
MPDNGIHQHSDELNKQRIALWKGAPNACHNPAATLLLEGPYYDVVLCTFHLHYCEVCHCLFLAASFNVESRLIFCKPSESSVAAMLAPGEY